MLKLTILFTMKGLLSMLLCIFLFWLLRDYPCWRAERDNSNNKTDSKNKTSSSKKVEIDEQQCNDKEDKKPIDNLSLAHYILVTPFAALYIIGRAFIDTVRFSLYFVIWSCEKSIPYIDDWLFDTVTIWMPKKYNDVELWWIEKGRPNLTLFKNHLQTHTIPTTVEKLELFFVKLYDISCIVQSCTQEFIAAWKRFIQQHDWHQLAIDMSEIAYIIFWNPSVWIVTRSINLCVLVYGGLCSAITSIKNDIKWIFTVFIPTIYGYIRSSQLAKILYFSLTKVSNGLQWICTNIYTFIIAPTLGRLLTWLVKSIDLLLISLLQSRTLQEKLNQFYRWITPNLVWILFESSSLVRDIVTWGHILFTQLLYPAYILFMKHVVPHLAIAYRSIIVRWIYELHLYPTWLKIYPYLNAPLFWIYTQLTIPIINNLYTIIASISGYVTQHLLAQLQALLTMFMICAQIIYSSIQSWLLRQAPLLSNILQKSLQLILNFCDWDGLIQETLLIATSLYDWISEQSNLIYLSLERSLTTWAQEQQQHQEGSVVEDVKKQKMMA